MKKLLSALMILMLLLSSACAETSLITGEVVEVSAPGDVRILVNESAFEATYNDKQFFGAVQADGTLLLGTPEKAVRLAGLPDLNLFADVWQRLDTQPTYDNAVYSSLFTEAQQIELTAREVCDYMLAILNVCPLLDPDGSLREIALNSNGNETWATVTRYVADPVQYPDTWMVQVNVLGIAFPAMQLEYRQDEYGSNFQAAVAAGAVADWDETMDAILNDSTGGAGRMVKGFTMKDDGGTETWIYLEVSIHGFPQQWRLALDMYRNNDDARMWHAVAVLNDDATNTPILAVGLDSEGTELLPMTAFDNAVIVDGTDGLDEAERMELGL